MEEEEGVRKKRYRAHQGTVSSQTSLLVPGCWRVGLGEAQERSEPDSLVFPCPDHPVALDYGLVHNKSPINVFCRKEEKL